MTERDQLHQLERDVSEKIGQALGTLRERLGGLLRETHDALLDRLDGIEPEMPDRFLDDKTLQALGDDAENKGRCTAFGEIADALRSIDKAGSQAAVLTALLDGSMSFANRAAFFLIRNGQVHGWGLRTASDELRALSSVQFTSSGSWDAVAAGGGASWLDEPEREEVAVHLDGLTAEDAILIPFVLRDALAGVLYVDGVGDAVAALQTLAYVSAQAVEILPMRQRSETATLAGPDAISEESPIPAADEVFEAEAEREPVEPLEAAVDQLAEEAEEATPDALIEVAAEYDEPAVDYEESAIEPAVEIPEESEPVVDDHEPEFEVEAESSEPIALEETTAEIDTSPYGDEEPEPSAIEDVSGGAWSLEDAASTEDVDVMAAETAAVPTQPAVDDEEPVAAAGEDFESSPEESTWSEPAEPELDMPALEIEDSPEFDLTDAEEPEPEPAFVPTGEETVLIRTPVMTTEPAVHVEPPEPEPEPEEPPATQVTPPDDMNEFTSTQVAPPSDFRPVVESPLVTPPSDLEGPGRAFATTRVPIDAEQVQAHEEARRLARLLVSEIKLYNEEEVEEGRRAGDVYARLREDINRSRQMFEERIDSEVKESTDYFHQELVRILGGGDADALGM